jgi:hypothetical protein
MKRATPLLVVAVVGAGIIVGTLVRPLAARMDATPPQIGWGPATMLFTFALLIAAMAWNTWQSLHKKHERMTLDHGVKMLALSRSSLIVGGLFGGGYGGYALSFVPDLDTPDYAKPQYTQKSFHGDDWKWSVHAIRTIVPGMKVKLQAANDHIRTHRLEFNGPSLSPYPLTLGKRDLYYLVHLQWGI